MAVVVADDEDRVVDSGCSLGMMGAGLAEQERAALRAKGLGA